MEWNGSNCDIKMSNGMIIEFVKKVHHKRYAVLSKSNIYLYLPAITIAIGCPE